VGKRFAWIITSIGALIYFIYLALNVIGVLQTAQNLFQNRGTFLKILVILLTSQWLPLGLFLLGVIALLYIYIAQQIKGRPRTTKYPQPLFAIECGPDVPGSEKSARWANGPEGMPVKFLRVVVHVAGKESVQNCTGYLTEIRKNHEKRWEGDNAKLTFAPGEDSDALSKTIHERMPEFLDVLIITSKNQIHPGTKGRGWPYVPALHEIFSEPGDYFLSVSITGRGIATASPQLTFTWTQHWETSQLRL
jgi:hypothetical protein